MPSGPTGPYIMPMVNTDAGSEKVIQAILSFLRGSD